MRRMFNLFKKRPPPAKIVVKDECDVIIIFSPGIHLDVETDGTAVVFEMSATMSKRALERWECRTAFVKAYSNVASMSGNDFKIYVVQNGNASAYSPSKFIETFYLEGMLDSPPIDINNFTKYNYQSSHAVSKLSHTSHKPVYDSSSSDDSDGEPWLSDYTMLDMRPTTRRKIRAKMNQKRVYEMSQFVRGRAMILHMEYFYDPRGQESVDKREGSDVDFNHMHQLLTDLGFRVQNHENLPSEGVLDAIKEETKHPDHGKYGMFVLVVLSHGSEGFFCGSDGQPVYEEDLFKLLSPKNFPGMTGKPKWIIMQCCSGSGVDKIHEIQTDSRRADPVTVPTPTDQNYSSCSDLVIFKASFPGFKALRHRLYGTCFIKLLVELFYKHACHSDITALGRKLRKRVIRETNKARAGTQTVTVTDTLQRELYLFPSYNPDI